MAMPSKEIYRGVCTMLKRKFGTTALEIQYKYKLDFADTIYYITKAKEEFSNSQNSNIQKWSAYISGNVLRQDYLQGHITLQFL